MESGAPMDSFDAKVTVEIAGKDRALYSFERAAAAGLTGIDRMPVSRKILLENLLRHEDGDLVTPALIEDFIADKPTAIYFCPARIFHARPARAAAVGGLGKPAGRCGPGRACAGDRESSHPGGHCHGPLADGRAFGNDRRGTQEPGDRVRAQPGTFCAGKMVPGEFFQFPCHPARQGHHASDKRGIFGPGGLARCRRRARDALSRHRARHR